MNTQKDDKKTVAQERTKTWTNPDGSTTKISIGQYNEINGWVVTNKDGSSESLPTGGGSLTMDLNKLGLIRRGKERRKRERGEKPRLEAQQQHCQCRSGSPDTCPKCTDMETGERYSDQDGD